MAGGGALVAAAEGLARDADEAAGQIGDSTAALFEKTADNEESNLARTLDSDAQTAQQFTQAGARNVGTVEQGAADAAPAADAAAGDVTATGDGDVSMTPPGPVTADGVGPCGKVGEPIDVVGGQMVTAKTDVELPGVLPLVLRRAYASGYRSGRLFGPGWASTLDIRLKIDADGIHFAGDDAQILHYSVPAQPGQQVFPADGARWPLTWDREADEIRVQDVTAGRTWHFTVLGRTSAAGAETRPLTALSDRNGNRIVFERDEDGLPVEVRHSGGYRIAVDTIYTAAGFRVEALRLLGGTNADQDSTLLTYQYDPRGRLVGLIDSTGVPFVYEHDDADRITAWIDRVGYRFEYVYDQAGRVIRTSGDGGYLSGSLTYDPENRVTIYTDSLGHSTEHHYDRYGHVTKTVDALGNATVTESDRYGRLLSHTDPLGNTTRYSLDENGDPIRIDRPDGTCVLVTHSDTRLPAEVTGPDGTRWQYAYDDRGNLTAQTDPLGAVTAYSYGDRGELQAITDALGYTTAVTTNSLGLPISVTDPTGAAWTIARDSRSRITATTDPLGSITTMVWTAGDDLSERIFPDGTSEIWQRNPNGELTAYTNQGGFTTAFEVGPFQRVTSRTDPDGTHYGFTHDTELRLTTVTNPQGLTWQYSYDAAGNLTREQDFNDRTLGYSHDSAGRVVRRLNGAGESIDLIRDTLGQVIERRTDDGSTTTFDYDRAGRLTGAAGPDCAVEMARDPLGRVLAETVNGRTMASAYDLLGRQINRITPTGRISAWQYDQAGRPATLTSGAQQLSFGHDAAGQETHRWISPTAALTNAWDSLGRLTSRQLVAVEGQAAEPTSRLLHERTWTYRADSAPDTVTDTSDGIRQFDLDPMGRVTAVHAATWTEQYAYDGSGNLSHASDTRSQGPDSVGPRVLSGTLLHEAGRTRYEYDAQGRMVKAVRRTLSGQQKVWAYMYNALDQLTEVTSPSGERWRYVYDPFGRRISKQRLAVDGSPLEEIAFTWDGAVLIEQHHVRTGTFTAIATSWDHEPGTWIPVAQNQRTFYAAAPQEVVDEQFHAIITDLVGTPTELVTPDGRIAWRQRTGLWGGHFADSDISEVDCPLRFPGQYHDQETGLDYNYLRYYDPEAARFTTPDPLGLVPSFNHFAYVDNPLSWLDPLGLAKYRGARAGETPTFGARPGEYKVDSETGFVKPTHGVSLFDNTQDITKNKFEPYTVDETTVPDTLQIKQRGKPGHYEIMPSESAKLTPDQYQQELAKIKTVTAPSCGGE